MVDYDAIASSLAKRIVASDVRELLKLTEGRKIISFAGGLPDPTLFPKEELAEIARQVISERGEKVLQYSPTPGVGEFRRELASYLNRVGVAVREGDEILVSTGSQEALFLLGMAFVNPGDTVVMEEPGYLAAINLFRMLGARMVPVRVDSQGMDTDDLRAKMEKLAREGVKPKLIYTNPTCNNPNGTTMPMKRRRELLDIAAEYDVMVVEDDPYSYFTFEEVEFQHLKTMDKEGRVIYLGTMSKILVPGLRIGWALGPARAIRRMELVKQIVDLHSSTLSQYIALEALRRGIVDKVVAKARSLYRRKRDEMLAAMDEHMAGLGEWTRPIGGFFIFFRANARLDFKAMLPEAVERGVAYVPGQAFFIEGDGRNTMRLSYSEPSPEEIRRGIEILAGLIKEKVGGKA